MNFEQGLNGDMPLTGTAVRAYHSKRYTRMMPDAAAGSYR